MQRLRKERGESFIGAWGLALSVESADVHWTEKWDERAQHSEGLQLLGTDHPQFPYSKKHPYVTGNRYWGNTTLKGSSLVNWTFSEMGEQGGISSE